MRASTLFVAHLSLEAPSQPRVTGAPHPVKEDMMQTGFLQTQGVRLLTGPPHTPEVFRAGGLRFSQLLCIRLTTQAHAQLVGGGVLLAQDF